jgi:hypothetical protein
MRRTDQPGSGPYGRPSYWLRFSCPTDPLGRADQAPGATPGNDPADEPHSNWESAWIDLGGEG